MAKDSKNRPKESEFKKFVKKRAPIYIAVAALIVVFVVPELTKSNLQSHFPENLTVQERQILDTLMRYDGLDDSGLELVDALSEKITDEYPDEKIYDSKNTSIEMQITGNNDGTHQVLLYFKSYKGQQDYSWNVNMDTGKVSGNNPKAKHVVDLVDYYD